MRTKALILGAAFVAAGVASSMAQSNVYSLNIVGYVNVAVPQGFSILSNPLDDGLNDGNLISSVLSNTNTPDQSEAFIYTPAGGFAVTETYFAASGGTPGQWFPATSSLPPGAGFFYFSPSPTNITFVGQIAAGTYTNKLAANAFNLVGSIVPEALPVGQPGVANTLQLQVSDQDGVYTFNQATGYDTSTFFGGPSGGWFDSGVAGGGSTNGPTIAVGQGFFLLSPAGGNWVQTFSVN